MQADKENIKYIRSYSYHYTWVFELNVLLLEGETSEYAYLKEHGNGFYGVSWREIYAPLRRRVSPIWRENGIPYTLICWPRYCCLYFLNNQIFRKPEYLPSYLIHIYILSHIIRIADLFKLVVKYNVFCFSFFLLVFFSFFFLAPRRNSLKKIVYYSTTENSFK